MVNGDEQLYSIKRLHELTGLDRTTVAKRLKEIEPQEGKGNAKVYTLAAALPALVAGASAEWDAAKLKKTQMEGELRELELATRRGEYVPVGEVRDYALRLFKGLHNRIAIRYPRDSAQQLYKAESADQIVEIQQRELGRLFNDLRDDHKRFL